MSTNTKTNMNTTTVTATTTTTNPLTNSVIFKIYIKDNNENSFIRDYIFFMHQKIIDIKKTILNDIFKNEYNDILMDNITERVYKDFGKLYFEKGILPKTINNYKLSEITNENRTFSFIISPQNIVIDTDANINIKKTNENSILKKLINDEKKNNNNDLCLDDFDAFPPLK